MFPAEIVEDILQRLPTSSLLKHRLVNQNWHDTCSILCRQRFVTLAIRKLQKTKKRQVNTIFDVFHPDDPQLPWSSFKFGSILPSVYDRDLFLQSFGPHLLHLEFEPFCRWDRLQVILHTPNLRSLKVDHAHLNFLQPEAGVELMSLTRLTHLCVTANSFYVIDYVMKAGARLKYVELAVFSNDVPDLPKLAKLLTGVISISVKFSDLHLKPRTHIDKFHDFLRLNITGVEFDVHDEPSQRTANVNPSFARIEGVLGDCMKLKGLQLNYIVVFGNPFSILVPSQCAYMPNLEDLSVSLQTSMPGFFEQPIFPTAFTTSELDANQWPALKTLSIDFDSYVKKQVPLFDSCPDIRFESVTKLRLDGNIKGNWAQLCPNLALLDIGITSEASLEQLFLNTSLQDLKIRFGYIEETSQDLMSNYYLFGTEMSAKVSSSSQLTSLKHLQRLSVSFKHKDIVGPLINPNSILVRVHPLVLDFNNVQVTATCKRRLAEYHIHVGYTFQKCSK